MVQHLQRQLAQRDAELEQMAGLKKRESELKEQVETLQEKLREAKRSQAPVCYNSMFFFQNCQKYVRTTNIIKSLSKIFSHLDVAFNTSLGNFLTTTAACKLSVQ
jgi:hypothetical protein